MLRWRLVASAPRRRLHARHAKAAATLLSPDRLHLSPVHGLLLYGSPALGSLWAEGERDGPAVARLARALFNRHEAKEPLVPARNRSAPAVWLTPELQGHCLGLALRGAPEAEVRSHLIALGVDAIARESKVSIARFERLVALLGEAGRSPQLLSGGSSEETGVELCGTTVMLAYVWATARSKRCLLAFLTSLQPHVESCASAEGAFFDPATLPACADWLDGFDEPFGDQVTFMLGGGSRSIPPEEAELEALCEGSEVPPSALEQLAFQLVARSGCAPEVAQQVYGYRGQPPIADCVEACIREALGLAMWDGAAFDASQLPASSDEGLVDYFGGASEGREAGQAWFDLLSARPGLDYMLGSCQKEKYELFPSIVNFADSLSSLLRIHVPPPAEGEPMQPLWPGCALHWQRAGTSRHPELLLRRCADAAPIAGSAGVSDGSGDAMRVVFNGARHCYSIRDATNTEPAWVGRVRQAWRRRLPRAPSAAAAAARLLGLRGPCEMARHEALHLELEERSARG